MVQRGDLACFDKWTRAKASITNGIDLAIELPTVNVLSSAKRFAESSVYLLSQFNIDALSFGSELGDTDLLSEIADISIEIENSDAIKNEILSGITYPQALTQAIDLIYGAKYSNILTNPNNLLGIEYIKAIKKFAPNIQLFTVKREQAEHDSMETGDNISSASYIRQNISNINTFTPDISSPLYNTQIELGNAPILISNIERAVLIKLRQMSPSDFLKIADVSNGLENRLVKSAQTSKSLEEFYLTAKSKSYTHARIRRIVLNSFLNINNELTCSLPQYARILGMNNNGKEILKSYKQYQKDNNISTDFLVSPKFATLYKDGNSFTKTLLDIDIKATDISSVASPNILDTGLDFIRNTIIL